MKIFIASFEGHWYAWINPTGDMVNVADSNDRDALVAHIHKLHGDEIEVVDADPTCEDETPEEDPEDHNNGDWDGDVFNPYPEHKESRFRTWARGFFSLRTTWAIGYWPIWKRLVLWACIAAVTLTTAYLLGVRSPWLWFLL